MLDGYCMDSSYYEFSFSAAEGKIFISNVPIIMLLE